MSQGKMTVLTTDGISHSIDLDREATLEEVREKLSGGYAEQVHTQFPELQVLVDEDGLMKRLPKNHMASLMTECNIVGPCVILEGKAKWTTE